MNDKFTHKMSEIEWESSCGLCRHLRANQTCVAFPRGIPREIWDGKHKHKTPYPGDNGIRYEPWPTKGDKE